MAEEIIKTTDTEETKVEETKADETKVDERTTQALEVLDILEDPQRAHAFIENLAKQAGLVTAETKQEVAKATKTARDIVAKHLGPDYKNVAEKLGDAIDEYLSDKLGEFGNRFETLQKSQAQDKFSLEFDNFITTNKVTDEEAGQILKRLEVVTPNPKVPLKNFLQELLDLTRFNAEKANLNRNRQQRQTQNFQNRATNAGTEGNAEHTIAAPKSFSIQDAVRAAARGEKWE